MKYIMLHKIEEYDGTVFIGADIAKVFADHNSWCEKKKRSIINDLHSGHGEIMNWLYEPIKETDNILRDHVFYFRPLSRYGAEILRKLIYELIPGLTIRNSISCFLIDCWYKVEPHFESFNNYNSDYSLIYEYPKGSKQYIELDECDAHILPKIVELNKEAKTS